MFQVTGPGLANRYAICGSDACQVLLQVPVNDYRRRLPGSKLRKDNGLAVYSTYQRRGMNQKGATAAATQITIIMATPAAERSLRTVVFSTPWI